MLIVANYWLLKYVTDTGGIPYSYTSALYKINNIKP